MELDPSAQSSSKNENFVNTSKKILKNANATFVVPFFTWKQHFISNILSMIVFGNKFCFQLAPNPFKLNFFHNSFNSETFKHRFKLKLEQLICKKVLTFVLIDNYCSNLFIEVQFLYRMSFKFFLGCFFTKIK